MIPQGTARRPQGTARAPQGTRRVYQGTGRWTGGDGGEEAVVTAFTVVTDAVQTAGFTGGNASTYILNGIEYQGAVSVVDGKQYVVGIDINTGLIVSKFNNCDAYTAYLDDHNPGCPWLMDDGVTAVFLTTAHNVEAIVRVRRSLTGDPADSAAETTIATVSAATYPTPLEHPGNGESIFAYRGNQTAWYLVRTLDDGANWTAFANPVWTHSDQTYCRFKRVGLNEYVCHAAANPISGDPELYSFRLNTSTGDIRNAAGTTIANFKTGSPAASANPSNADLFYTAPTGWSCSVGEVFEDGTVWYFTQGTADGQFDELWTSRCTTANLHDPADYVHVKVCDMGYGVGSTTATPWSSTPRVKEVKYPGVTRKMLAVSQLLRGTNYAFIMEQQDDFTWKNVLFFNEAPAVTDHSEYIAWPLGEGQGKALVAINPQDHADFDAITNATMEFLVVSSIGAAAPVITTSPTQAVDEYSDWLLELTADQPCGFNIVGGADAADFDIIGGKYLHLIHAADYDAPHDADTDNAFDVQVAARGFGNDLESAAFTITLSINQITKTGGSQLFTQTADLTNAAWTASGLGTRVNNSTDVTDPDGGNTMDKLPQSTGTTSHNVNQAKTLTASTKYTTGYEWVLDDQAPFAACRLTYGTGNGSTVAKFDLRRGQLVNVGVSVAPLKTFCLPLAAGKYRLGQTIVAPATTAAGQAGPAVCQFAGPSTTETGITTAAGYVRYPNLMLGDYKTHVVRTT
jgi:hypothetical protein